MAGLLNGVKAIELGLILPSGYLGNLLADQGAEVIKIENPPHGDYVRDFPGQIAPHHSKYHLFLNRNKKSVAVNLRAPEGRQVLHRLVKDADVFFTNLIADQPNRMGADYETIRELNPAIIYCQITGFGVTGPYAKIPTHGVVMSAAIAQIAVATGDEGCVQQVPATVTESGTAMAGSPVITGPLFAAYGIAAALWRRATTGKGAFLEMSNCDAALCAAWPSIPDALNEGRVKNEGTDPMESARHNFYETKDGRYVFIALIEPKFWLQFCKSLGRDDLLEGVDREALAFDFGDGDLNRQHFAELRKIFRGKTRDEWVDFFTKHDLPAGPVNAAGELDDDPQFSAREIFAESIHPLAGKFRMATEPIKVLGERFEISPAPSVGEHTEEVLSGLGYSGDELARLEESGVIVRTIAGEHGE